jgi:hypothetical protein
MMKRRLKCLYCKGIYFGHSQVDAHIGCRYPTNAKILQAGGGTIAESHPSTEIRVNQSTEISLDPKKIEPPPSTLLNDVLPEKKIKIMDVPSFIVNKMLTKEQKKEAQLAKKREVWRKRYQAKTV